MSKSNNLDINKKRGLIKKLRILAERGEKYERESAKNKLNELMKKYNIKKLEESKKKKRIFKLADFYDCKTIMVHCILDTDAKADISGSLSNKSLYCVLNNEQYIEVCEKFNHYYYEYINQKDVFLKAFIIKNDIGIIDANSESNESDNEVSEILDMMDVVKNKQYKKAELCLG